MTASYSFCVTSWTAEVKRLREHDLVLRRFALDALLPMLVVRSTTFSASSISSGVLPIVNSPGGMRTNFMPIELVYSSGSFR